MIFTTLKRITRTGFINFWRNGFLSFAAIVVMTLALSTLGGLMFASAFSRTILNDIKEKVDINVYFSLSAPEVDMEKLAKDIEALPEVAKVTLVTREEALAEFKERWSTDSRIMQGLEEVGSNPFPASLNIKAKEPGQYAGITKFIENKNPKDSKGSPIIDKINYYDNKLIIDRLSKLIPLVEKTGVTIVFVFGLVSIIVVFNTIRLIIYTAKDEISVMKLVGASNTYVRGPFVVSGIMYGVASGIITLILMAVVAYWGDTILLKVAGINVAYSFDIIVSVLSSFFSKYFGQIFTLIIGFGIVLGGVSSYIAARRYLKV